MKFFTFLGRRWRYEAGGHSATSTGPESIVPSSGVSLRRSPALPGGSRRRPGT
jgi:hypothetical protein